MMAKLRILPLLALCAVAMGCSSIQRPTASVKSARLGTVDASGFTMNFDVELANPNPVAVPLGETDYKLALGGTEVLRGVARPEGNIPAGGSLAVALPVQVSFDNLLKAADAVRKSRGDVPYAFEGGMTVSGSLLGSQRIPLSYQGTLPLRQMLKDPMLLIRSDAARALAEKLVGGR